MFKAEHPPLKLVDKGYSYAVVREDGTVVKEFVSDERGRGRKPGSAKSKLDTWFRSDASHAVLFESGAYHLEKRTSYEVTVSGEEDSE